MKNKHLGRFCQKIYQFGFLPLLEDSVKKDYQIYIDKNAKKYDKRKEELSYSAYSQGNNINTHSSEIQIPYPISLSIVNVICKQYDFICNYIYFQICNKIFGIASVVFSFICLYINQSGLTDSGNTVKYINLFCSFISIVCIIIALYLSPVSRVSQYINSWKMLDAEINRIYSSLYLYDQLSKRYSVDATREQAIEDIKKEAMRISSVIETAEMSLTSDGE